MSSKQGSLFLMPPVLATLAAAAILAVIFIVVSYRKSPVAALVAKTIASLAFVALGILCFLSTGRGRYGGLILAGLLFGLAGDVLLELQPVFPKKKNLYFLFGLSAFLIGHIFYVVAFSGLAPLGILHPIIFVATLCVALLLKAVFKVKPGKMLLPVLLYAAVISLMVAMAFGAPFSGAEIPPAARIMLPAAALLFLVSDAVLAYIYFGDKKAKPLVAVNLSTYYAAQILLALTILYI